MWEKSRRWLFFPSSSIPSTQKQKQHRQNFCLSVPLSNTSLLSLSLSLCVVVFSHGGSSSTKPNSTTTTTTRSTKPKSKPTATATASTTSGEAEPSGAAATEPGRGEDSSPQSLQSHLSHPRWLRRLRSHQHHSQMVPLSLSLSLSLTSFFVSPFKLFTFQRCKDFLGFCLNSKLDFLEIEWIFGFHFGFEGLQIAVFEEQQFASVTEKLKAIQFLEKLSFKFLFFVICLVTEKAKDSMISHFVLHYRFFLGFCFCLFGLKRNRRNLEKIIKIWSSVFEKSLKKL